jgi:hypothetical protein
LLETTVERLGALQFSDKCLTRNGQDEFEVASTPSHRSRQHGPRTSPLLYFVDLLVNQSEGKLSENVRLRALKLLVEPCLQTQNTRLSRLELLRDCAAVVNPSTTIVPTSFWMQIAVLVKACIEERSLEADGASRQLGKEYEVVVDVLRLGSPNLMKESLSQDLLTSFADAVRTEAGEGALVLAVVEKVSECILKQVSTEEHTVALPWLSVLLRNLPKTLVRRTLEQGRQKLWPSSSVAGRNPDFDPYNHLYDAIVSIGSAAYQELNTRNAESIQNFLASLASSIKGCPIALLAVYLRKVQATIRFWVEDPEKKLHKNDQQSKELHAQVCSPPNKRALTLTIYRSSSCGEKYVLQSSVCLARMGRFYCISSLSSRRDFLAGVVAWSTCPSLHGTRPLVKRNHCGTQPSLRRRSSSSVVQLSCHCLL